ncbi:DUF2202 domain-containing protein [Ectothiorhodospiraceae bacterium BW-2]|nr:DUF2202 domain-containing protein [Ectothiorhodospiraceae bacterium BW-2]
MLITPRDFIPHFIVAIVVLISLAFAHLLLSKEEDQSISESLTRINNPFLNAEVTFQPVAATAATTAALSQQELSDLRYMREEEKLARDVYQQLYQRWGLSIFAAISRSEQIHTDRVLMLLQRYQIPDPAANLAPGQFQNRHLATLYRDLIQRGEQSTLEALRVGALIEEVDIDDLDKAMANSAHQDITQVYHNIQQGSYRHLQGFVHSIEQFGQRYQAVVLPQSRVDEIVHAPFALPLTPPWPQQGQNRLP